MGPEGIGKLKKKKINNLIENRTFHLPICSIVPQKTYQQLLGS
jgi:hypothetical protein